MKKLAIMFAMIIALSSCIVLPLSAQDEYTVNTQVAGAMLKSKSESSKELAEEKAAESGTSSSSKKSTSSSKKSTSSSKKSTSSSKKPAASDETKDIAKVEDKVLASAFKSTDGSNFVTVSGDNFKSIVEKKIMVEMNKVRAQKGLEPLVFDVALQSAARIRARELYKAGPRKFAHKRPNGDDWSTVIKVDVPVMYRFVGENLCMTEYNDPDIHYATSADFYMDQWVDSPSHYANIIRPEFTHAGVAVYVGTKNGMTYGYAATVFATPKQ